MTDDLVKRLRWSAQGWLECDCQENANMDTEAADRIEELSEKLHLCIQAIEAQDALKDLIEKREQVIDAQNEHIRKLELFIVGQSKRGESK